MCVSSVFFALQRKDAMKRLILLRHENWSRQSTIHELNREDLLGKADCD